MTKFFFFSYESGVLEDPNNVAPEELYQMTSNPFKAPDVPDVVEITFVNGLPTSIVDERNNVKKAIPMEIFHYLNTLG